MVMRVGILGARGDHHQHDEDARENDVQSISQSERKFSARFVALG